MNCPLLKSYNFLVGLGLFISAILPISAEAADGVAHKPTPPAAAVAQSSASAGAVEDTLQACMTRIPKDASLGQRLIAERTCARDDNDRKPFQSAPVR
ncbi:MAG: hypothetical protein A2V62_07140 [Nitrospirae bacterium RBG_19FT_COMBO_58_9]|nr:MAG: hypothetical protein A2V62_07140 [Nitrospirae bacterium RBG_19FT_COMBO_58_9]